MNFKSKNIKNTNSQFPAYKILTLYIHTPVYVYTSPNKHE